MLHYTLSGSAFAPKPKFAPAFRDRCGVSIAPTIVPLPLPSPPDGSGRGTEGRIFKSGITTLPDHGGQPPPQP